MKKILILLTVSLLITSCKTEKPNYAIISGKVLNAKADSLLVICRMSKNVKKIPIAADGSFLDTLQAEDTGFIFLPQTATKSPDEFYISKGEKLELNFDASKIESTLTVSGNENNFLFKLKEYNNKLNTKFTDSVYLKSEAEFKQLALEVKDELTNFISSAKDLNEDFKNLLIKQTNYDYLMGLWNYIPAHIRLTNNNDYRPSNVLLEDLNTFPFDDVLGYKTSRAYRKLIYTLINKEVYDKYENENDSTVTIERRALDVFGKIDELKNDYIRQDLLNMYGYQAILALSSPTRDEIQKIVTKRMSPEDKEKFDTDIEKQLARGSVNKPLIKGTPSPKFVNYINHAGGTTSLDDLKGKYVYIDVWATWCGPCIMEIPSLKKVEKQFHGKNITFVSISVDTKKDTEKWRKMVTDKQLGGVQLLADNALSSAFVKNYGISGIPRFILLDPQGNIIESDAPRPSNPKLIELLNSLKI